MASGGSFWKERANTVKPEQPRRAAGLSPHLLIQLSPNLQIGSVAIVGSRYVFRQEGVTLNGKSFAFVGNVTPVAPMLREIRGPVRTAEVLQRWSRRMPSAHAMQFLEWAWAEELIEGHSAINTVATPKQNSV